MFGPKLERPRLSLRLSLRPLLGLFLISVFGSAAHAQNLASAPTIFDVRRSLPLEPTEPVYKDFYISAGPEAGFKKGQYVSVVRLVPVHDPVQLKQHATLTVNVAKLFVIHTERNITVARLQNELTDEERPTLEYESVMIGDKIDTAQTTTEAPKKKSKTAQAPKETTVQVAIVPAVVPVEVKPEESVQVAAAPIVGGSAPPKTASPESAATDIVRVPVPAAAPSK